MSYAPNYAWVGAPTEFNGTGRTGGDSGKTSRVFPPFSFRGTGIVLVPAAVRPSPTIQQPMIEKCFGGANI